MINKRRIPSTLLIASALALGTIGTNVAAQSKDGYVQDTRDQTLGRYVQAVFTYTFR